MRNILLFVICLMMMGISHAERLQMEANEWDFFGKAKIKQGDIVYSLKRNPKDQISLYNLEGIDRLQLESSLNKANAYYRIALLFDIPGIVMMSGGALLSVLAFVDEGVIYTDILTLGIMSMGVGYALHLPAIPIYKAGNKSLKEGIIDPYNRNQSKLKGGGVIDKINLSPIVFSGESLSFGINLNFIFR